MLAWMLSYWNILKTQQRYLAYGTLHTFFSGFGQTFFFALFVTEVCEKFGLSRAGYGSMYGVATVISALLLPFVGSWLDRVHLRWYSLAVGITLAASLLTIGLSENLVILFIGLTLLRHTGQALMTLIAGTSISRYFTDLRGKALSVSNLGYPLAEAILPLSFAALLASYHWQDVLMGLAAFVLVVFSAISIALIRPEDPFMKPSEIAKKAESSHSIGMSRNEVLRSPYFQWALPAYLMVPFLLTGIVFHQSSLAAERGWTLTLIATSFTGFAIGQVLASLVVGVLIDRYTAQKIFYIHLIPVFLATLILGSFSHPVACYVSYFLMGSSAGFGKSIKQALFAEVYGVKHLASIKSMTILLTVLSTAVSPFLFGYLLESGFDFSMISHMCAALIAASVVMWKIGDLQIPKQQAEVS